jgi:hypothetical protein
MYAGEACVDEQVVTTQGTAGGKPITGSGHDRQPGGKWLWQVIFVVGGVIAAVVVLSLPAPSKPWAQGYDPTGRWWLSTICAALPIVVLLGSLALFRMKAHYAALLGLATSFLCATWIFGMPLRMASKTVVLGAGFGLLPIGWIILNVIFLYNLTVDAGLFKVMQESLMGITQDRRLQLLLIAFSFGAFFEGAAGFGTPVAVTAAILIGLGFGPLEASGLSLIANTAPVAFGALGVPIVALQAVTGLDLMSLGAQAGRILPFFSALVPFWLIWAFAGFQGMLEVWPAVLVAGVFFAVPQYLVSNFHGPWLVDIIASIVSMGNSQRHRISLGSAFGEGKVGQTFQSDVSGGGIAPDGVPRSAGCASADEGSRGVFSQLALGHRLGDSVGESGGVPGDRLSPVEDCQDLLENDRHGALLPADNLRHAGVGLHHALFGIGRHHGARIRAHRRPVSLFWHDAGLVGCGPDRLRHIFQRAVRELAENFRRAHRPFGEPDGRGQ